MKHRGHPRSRSRRLVRPGHWAVNARVERFVEPTLYRLLRALEDEGIVRSEWSADLPGPAKRTYELTTEGRRLLDRWAEALQRAQGTIASFLDRYEASLATPASGRAVSARASVGTNRSAQSDQ